MNEIKPIDLKIETEEMHVVRRLGKATILHWDHIPENVQEILIKQARAVHDEYQTTQVNEQISGVLQQHKKNS